MSKTHFIKYFILFLLLVTRTVIWVRTWGDALSRFTGLEELTWQGARLGPLGIREQEWRSTEPGFKSRLLKLQTTPLFRSFGSSLLGLDERIRNFAQVPGLIGPLAEVQKLILQFVVPS